MIKSGKEYFDKKLAEIPRDMLEGAVNFLKSELSEEVKIQLREVYAADPEHWISRYHFGWGMGVRNSLRDAGFKDDRLPGRNWDDYYFQLIEIAIGVRDMPKGVVEKEEDPLKHLSQLQGWWDR